jgi:hypothetical protein
VIVGGPFADIGLTPGFLAMIVIFGLGSAAVAAVVVGGIAVAIIGPRRWDAVTLPSVVAFVLAVASALVIRDAQPLWVVVAMFVAALLVAWLQKANIEDDTAPSTGEVFVVGRLLVGLMIGAAVGLAAAAATQGVFPLVLCVLIGLALGLRSAMSANAPAVPEAPGPVVAAEPEPPAGMLDE